MENSGKVYVHPHVHALNRTPICTYTSRELSVIPMWWLLCVVSFYVVNAIIKGRTKTIIADSFHQVVRTVLVGL